MMSRIAGGKGWIVANAADACLVELLEVRQLFSMAPGPTSGLTAAEVRHAYGFDQITFQSGNKTIAGNGSGQTIAIIVAYSAPTLGNDLRVFDRQFGLPNQTGKGGGSILKVATPQGHVGRNASWAQESTLDVEWAHAIAPGARILLVEAKSDNAPDLFNAVDWARQQRGVSVVSMSWGWDSPPATLPNNSIYTTPLNHIAGSGRGDGVTFVEAAADDGNMTAWPNASVPVITVGGTTLTLDDAGNYLSETRLSQSVQPAIVAYNADPASGYAIYDSTPDGGLKGWQTVGGTSAGTPQWAALFAIANQGRALEGKRSLDNQRDTMPALQSAPDADFHAILDSAPATGRGSPFADKLIADLVMV